MKSKLSKTLIHLAALAIALAACTPAATPMLPQASLPTGTSVAAPTDIPVQMPTQEQPTAAPPTATLPATVAPTALPPAITWNPRFATYLGGSGNEGGATLITNASGSLFMVGNTNSEDFPVTANAYDTTFNGGGADGYGGDVYVAKINPSGSGLDFATFVGGSQRENHTYFAVADEQGNIYVTGQTDSSDFPVTEGAFDTEYNQNKDAFVFKLDATGTKLLYATYLGGLGADTPISIAIDQDGNVYVAGRTSSSDFPTTEQALDKTYTGSYDNTFVAKLDPTGSQLLYSTFLSETVDPIQWNQGALTVNAQGEVYLATLVSTANYPVTEGAYDTSFNGGGWDIYLLKLNASGSALELGTYLGGSGTEWISAIQLDGDGNILLYGNVQSDDFPTTADAYDRSYNGGAQGGDIYIQVRGGDVFLTKLDASGATLLYSTYLGGSGDEPAEPMLLGPSGEIYFAMSTSSTDLPVTVSVDGSPRQSGNEVYFGKLDPTLKQLAFGAYLGGSGYDAPTSIVLDSDGMLLISGMTTSDDFPMTQDAFQQAPGNETMHDDDDAFIVSFPPLTAVPTITDIDGNLYNTITIGAQTWMQENLKTTRYSNGDVISTTIPATLDISSESAPKYQWAYDGDESNAAIYGRLYTWYAATDSRNICPAGWHVPSDAEWTTLTDFLGGENVAFGKLKETGTTHWNSPNDDATNESGFAGLPAGSHWADGGFESVGMYSHWWTTTSDNDEMAWRRALTYDGSYMEYFRGTADKKNGWSVRCVEDRD